MRIVLSAITIIISMHLAAQQTLPNLARPGAKGMFVMTGEMIPDVKGEITAYRIERKAGDEKDFTLLTTLPAVASIADFKQRVLQSNSWFPFAQDLNSLKLDSIWKKGKAAGNLNALRATGYSLPVLAGFNMVWLDEKVSAGKTYQYRITGVGNSYMVTSYPVLYSSPALASLQYDRALYTQPKHSMQLYWLATKKDKPVFIEAYRRETTGPFAKIPVSVSFLPKKDTIEYLIRDTTAMPDRLYSYYLKAYDALGNTAPISDTILIASLDYAQMPMPKQVKVISDSALHAIHISWQLMSKSLIKSLTLYRSTSSVKGFEPVAILSSADSVYADQQVKPATAYFYYFETEYKTQDKAKRSIPFAGSFTDNTAPTAPQNIQATGNKQGVELKWQYAPRHVSGFWLYRAERGKPMQLLTTMIAALPGQSDYTFTDTDSLLNGSRFYQYTLKAFSTSHIESASSDTVVARPLKNIPVPKPPMRVQTTREEALVLVYWDAVSKYDENVAGYKLIRSIKRGGAKGGFDTDTFYCNNNLYKDTLVKPGDTIRYSVITHSLLDVQSVPASWAYVSIPVNKPAPPAALIANRVKTGVQLNWEAPDNGVTLHYNVYRYERGKQPVRAGGTTIGEEMFIDKNVNNDKQYFYFVCAIGTDKIESARSNEAVVK